MEKFRDPSTGSRLRCRVFPSPRCRCRRRIHRRVNATVSFHMVVTPAMKTGMFDASKLARSGTIVFGLSSGVEPKKPLGIENEFSSAYTRTHFLRHFYSSMTRIVHRDGQAQFVNTNVTADGSISPIVGAVSRIDSSILVAFNREIKSKCKTSFLPVITYYSS